jgi:hypothetical protein
VEGRWSLALPPGAIGSAVTGRKVNTLDEACKGRIEQYAKFVTIQEGGE